MIQGLGEKIQEQRLLIHLSQKELANAIGVSASVISNYENGERTPSVEILIALASLFHCSTDYLLGLKQTERSKTLDASMLNPEQVQRLQHFLLGLL